MLSAFEQLFADFVGLAALFDDAQVTAVVAFLVDEACWSAVSGLAHVSHPFGHHPFGSLDKGLPFGWMQEDPPFGSVCEGHPSDLVHEGHPSGLVHEGDPFELKHEGRPSGLVREGHSFELEHEGHPFELEDEGPPYQVVWCQGPLVVAACCQELHY